MFSTLLECTQLKEFPFTMLFAKNGRDAIEQAMNKNPDIIFLDMKMPVMSGYEASEKLKTNQKTKDIPIIAVTASALKQDEEIISQICNGYLRKPITQSDLVKELMKFIPFIKTEKVQLPTPSEDAVEIIPPPIEELEKLYHLALGGNIVEIKLSASNLQERNSKYSAFSNKLIRMAEMFEMKKIVTFLEKYLTA